MYAWHDVRLPLLHVAYSVLLLLCLVLECYLLVTIFNTSMLLLAILSGN